MCIVGVKLPRVLSRRAGWSRGRSETTCCHNFFHSNQYSAHWKQFKVLIESNHTLRCHVTTLSWWQLSQSLPPSVAKMRVPVLRETERVKSNGARAASSASRGDNEVDHAVCLKTWISDVHCPFQWKWQVLQNYDISVLQQVGMFFDGIACFMKVWPLFKREFPRVTMTWRPARARISNATSQM